MQAVALECMRGAHRQGRDCYLYAFSGPQQCQELVLDHSPGSMSALLNFLSFSFLGGTDVDTPFLRALDRLTDAAWRLSDILLVRPRKPCGVARCMTLHDAAWGLSDTLLVRPQKPCGVADA